MKKLNYFKLFLFTVSILFSSVASAQFMGGGGNGSEEKPYLIEDLDHWFELTDYVLNGETYEGVYFLMQNDVDFNGFYNFIPVGGVGHDGWSFIEDDTKSFAGYFDGSGYSILNLEPFSITGNYLGLFGKTTGGYIKNLTIQGGYFMGDTYVGALIGYNAGAEVENCNSDATVVISGTSYIGGLIGYNGEGSTVSECESNATVSGLTYIGGLIGYSAGENVIDCTSEAVVTGTGNYIGGLIGYNTAEIIDCFSEATVTTSNQNALIGGLIAYNEGTVSGSGSRADVRNTSTVAGSAQIGGLIGYNNQGAITNCFSEATVSSRASGNRTGGLISQNNLASVSSSYSNATVNVTVTTLGNFYVGGFIAESSGTISDCYSRAKVTVQGPTPFAAGFIAYNKGTISNCYVSRNAELTANQNSQGKFGGLAADNEGLIENCYSEANITVKGTSSTLIAGGLVSNNWNVIKNSYVPAEVIISSEGNATTLGGLVGYTSSSSLIENCYSEATLRATNAGTGNLGGLIGTHAGEVKNSYSTGTLEAIGTSSFTIGGLTADDRGGTTNNCYSTAVLIGSSDLMRMGGLAGVISASTEISNSYAAPDLQVGASTSRFIGVFSGMNAPIAPLGFYSNNYHLIISGRAAQGGTIATPSPEITGKSSADLKLPVMVSSPGTGKNSLNFGQAAPLPWIADITPNVNSGYPILAWQAEQPIIPQLTVVTGSATAITQTSATVSGTVTEGLEPIINIGFEYKESNTSIWMSVTEPAESDLIITLNGLTGNTLYQFKAFANTASGTTYGDTKTFTTLPIPPIAETGLATFTGNTTSFAGTVTAGSEPITAQGIQYRINNGAWQTVNFNTGINLIQNQNNVCEYMAYATTASGTYYGVTVIFTRSNNNQLPIVITQMATNITATGATLSGEATTAGVSTQGFQYRIVNTTTWTNVSSSNNPMTAILTGLAPNTIYEYRATVNNHATAGAIRTFTTLPTPPIVTTGEATNVTAITANISGTVTATSEAIIANGFVYKKAAESNWTTTIYLPVSSTLATSLSGLDANNTAYQFSAFAITTSGITYGEIKSFFNGLPPTVTTGSVSNITKTSATISGTVIAQEEVITAQGLEYKKAGESNWTSVAALSATLSNLTPSTEYLYRAFATTASGFYYGEVKQFTTDSYLDFVIEKNQIRHASEYNPSIHGDIIFKSVGNEVGQLIIPQGNGSLTVNGVVKLQRAYTLPRGWATISFPYDVEAIYCPNFNGQKIDLKPHCEDGQGGFMYGSFYLKKYNGNLNQFYYSFEKALGGSGKCEDIIVEGVGYIIQFPPVLLNNENQLANENLTRNIVFESAKGITLRNSPNQQPKPNGNALIGNHVLQNTTLNGANKYFLLNLISDNSFGLVDIKNANMQIKPFEAYITQKNGSGTISLARAIDVKDVTSGLESTLETDKVNLIEVRYYNIQGIELKEPMPGSMYIEKRIYDNGAVETTKKVDFK